MIMRRRSIRKRKKRQFFVGETEVLATGHRRTKKKGNVADLSTWDQKIKEKHGNLLSERSIRAEASRRLQPLIQETIRQQDISLKATLKSYKLKKELQKNNVVLERALKRMNYLNHHLRSCRLELKLANETIVTSRKDMRSLQSKLDSINNCRDRTARKLTIIVKENQREKVCLCFCTFHFSITYCALTPIPYYSLHIATSGPRQRILRQGLQSQTR